MALVSNLIDTIFNNNFIKTISDVITFIINLPITIIKYLTFLPTEINNLLIPAITIAFVIFLYRFFK